MKTPSSKYPGAAGSFGSLAPTNLPDPSLNAGHFSDMIQNRGIQFIHSKAIPCPNVQDVDSMIHVSHCTHPGCSNGMLQVQPKIVWGYFNNDQLNKLYEIQGEYNENIAVITVAAHYENSTEEADVAAFDQLQTTADYTKRTYELVEANVTGLDRLKYYAKDVHILRTHEKEFTKEVDFTIQDGKIRWISNNRPGYNQQTQRGEIYSVGYYIQPIFFIHHVMKELRATQVYDPATGEKTAVRLPQHIMVLRELLQPDVKDDKGDQTAKMPRSGILTPR